MGTALTAEDVLSGASALLRRGWCQGSDACGADGQAVKAWQPEARSWSLLGALCASGGLDERAAPRIPLGSLATAAAAMGLATNAHSLQAWNDAEGRTQQEVLAAVDRAAIFIAEQEHELDGRAAEAASRN
jgi:hypothetical protein